VGTCYKEKGQEAALELGHRLVNGAVKDARVAAWCDFARTHRMPGSTAGAGGCVPVRPHNGRPKLALPCRWCPAVSRPCASVSSTNWNKPLRPRIGTSSEAAPAAPRRH
jgi:hypothetical protein